VIVAAGCGAAGRTAAPPKCIVRVFFCTSDLCTRPATRDQIHAVEKRLRARDDVYSVRFVSKAAALREMKKRFPDEVAGLPSNPFPDSLRVRPVKGAAPSRIAASVRSRRMGVHEARSPRGPDCG
jgi:cell division protein FtsX